MLTRSGRGAPPPAPRPCPWPLGRQSSACSCVRALPPAEGVESCRWSRAAALFGPPPSGFAESLLELCPSHCGETYLPCPGGLVGRVGAAAAVVVQGLLLLLLLLLLLKLLLLLQGLQVGMLLLQLALEPLRLALLLQLLPLVFLEGQRKALSGLPRGPTCPPGCCTPHPAPGGPLPAAGPAPAGAAVAGSPAAFAPPLTCA